MDIFIKFLAITSFVLLACFFVALIFIDRQYKELEDKQNIRIDALYGDIKGSYKYADKLENRIKILEFKEKARETGEMYIIDQNFFGTFTIKWLNGNEICQDVIKYFLHAKVNGKYIELFCLSKNPCEVKYADGDKLVDMDIEIYKKAFPERFIVEEETEEKKND